MKKVLLLVLTIVSLVVVFSACNKKDTYADKLKKERKSISRFIDSHDIEVIHDYPVDGIFENEKQYFLDSNTGVYFHVNNNGSGDSTKVNTPVYLRFGDDNIYLVSNDTVNGNSGNFASQYPVDFIYGNERTYISNEQFTGISIAMFKYYFLSAACSLPLKYGVLSGGKVSLIVPFSSGSTYQGSNYEALYIPNLTYTYHNFNPN